MTFVTVVAVKIRLWSITKRTGTVIGDVAFLTSCNRLDLYIVAVFEVRDEQSPVPFMVMKFDLGKFICFELLIFWRVGIIKSPLFKRDISADKLN